MAKTRQTGTEFIDALPDDGERRLMLAVLIDAIRNLAHGSNVLGHRQRGDWLRDRDWMRRDDATDPFSFVSICSALGLSPGYVRRRVRQMQLSHDVLHLHRYAAKAEESWERQRSNNIHSLRQTRSTPAKRPDASPRVLLALDPEEPPLRRLA